jgi:hypothetical protein
MDGQVAHLIMQHRPHNFLGIDLTQGLLEGIQGAQAQGARTGKRGDCHGMVDRGSTLRDL